MHPKKQNLKNLIESVVLEEILLIEADALLQEGIWSSIKNGMKFVTKLAYIQATKGPEAVKDEVILKIDNFIKKVKTQKINSTLEAVLDDIEEKVQEIKTIKQRARDSRGRFTKGFIEEF